MGSVKEKGEELLNPTTNVFNISDFLGKAQKNWYYLAAASVLLIIIYLIPSTITKDTQITNLANFENNPYWDNLLNQNMRSGVFTISVKSPNFNENYEDTIEFLWQAKLEGKTYTGSLDLIIMDNKESKVFEAEIKEGSYKLDFKLKPGLYYWILEYEKEMVYLGKFYYKKPN